jgi:hypothetical protein
MPSAFAASSILVLAGLWVSRRIGSATATHDEGPGRQAATVGALHFRRRASLYPRYKPKCAQNQRAISAVLLALASPALASPSDIKIKHADWQAGGFFVLGEPR